MDEQAENLPERPESSEVVDSAVVPEDWSTRAVPEAAGRAADFVVFLGWAEMLIFLIFGGVLTWVITRTSGGLIDFFSDLPNGENVEPGVIVQVHESAWLMMFAISALVGLPGLVLVILSRGIRRVHRMRIHVTQLILLTQIMVVGMILLFFAIDAIMDRKPPMLTMTIVLMGTPLAVMIYTMRLLMALRMALR